MCFLVKCPWTFTQVEHTLGHKVNLSKFQRMELVVIEGFLCFFFFNHNGFKLEINNKKKVCKHLEAKQHTSEQSVSHCLLTQL